MRTWPTDRLLLGGDYNPEQWPDATLDDDVARMQEAGVGFATVGVFSWALLEPEPERYETAWLDRAFIQAGATYVPKFPTLVTRLGAPATGPTDLPVPEPFDPDVPVDQRPLPVRPSRDSVTTGDMISSANRRPGIKPPCVCCRYAATAAGPRTVTPPRTSSPACANR